MFPAGGHDPRIEMVRLSLSWRPKADLACRVIDEEEEVIHKTPFYFEIKLLICICMTVKRAGCPGPGAFSGPKSRVFNKVRLLKCGEGSYD